MSTTTRQSNSKAHPDGATAVLPGYKRTEVGVIPDDWVTGRLEDFSCFISYGFTNPMPSVEHGIYMITAADITDGEIQYDTARHTTEFAYRTLLTPKSKPKKSDVLLTKDGSLGRLALVDDEVVCINQSVAIIRPNDKIVPTFLKLLLESPGYQRKMIEDAGGSTIKHIYITIVNLMPIAVPKLLPEQYAIAGALSDVDGLVGALDKLIAKKRAIKQAAMQQLLSGKTRLPGFSGEWETKRLGDVGDISSAGVDKKSRPDEEPIRLINYLDVYHKDFIYSDDLNHFVTAPTHQARRCAVQKGDVFFTPSSETRDDIGLSAVAMEDIPDAAYSYHVVRLRLRDEWDLRFRTYAFKTRAFLEQAETLCDGSGTRYVISQAKFRSMIVHIPSLSEQKAIATLLSDMDAEIAALERRRDKTKAIKQGMMQQLLTGRVRLVKPGVKG